MRLTEKSICGHEAGYNEGRGGGGTGEKGRGAGELGASESNKVYLIDCSTSIDPLDLSIKCIPYPTHL